MRLVRFNDGEGITYEDLNMVGQLGDRSLTRWVLAPESLGGMVHFVGDHVLRLARGSDFSLSGTNNRTVTLTRGYYALGTDPATDDAIEVQMGQAAGASYTLDVATSGSAWRRDILEARMEAETTGENETRDFEDAVTRVVTSQSVPKRRKRLVSIQVKKGTDQVSEALANANEPAVTSGWTKIYSVLVPPTGNNVDSTKVNEWHVPLSYRPLFSSASDFHSGGVGGTPPTAGGNDGQGPHWSAASGDTMHLYGRSPRHEWQMARLWSVQICVIARPSSTWSISIPDGTVLGTVIETFAAPTAGTTAAVFTAYPTGRPVWQGGGRSRSGGNAAMGPLVMRWTNTGDGTAAAKFFWANWQWFGY